MALYRMNPGRGDASYARRDLVAVADERGVTRGVRDPNAAADASLLYEASKYPAQKPAGFLAASLGGPIASKVVPIALAAVVALLVVRKVRARR